jgi:hypothetical protein
VVFDGVLTLFINSGAWAVVLHSAKLAT